MDTYKKLLLYGGAALLFIVISGAVGYGTLVYLEKRNEEAHRPSNPFVAVGGVVYLNISSSTDRIARLYSFDMATKEEKEIFPDSKLKYNPTLSPSGKYIAYTAAEYDSSSEFYFPHSDRLQLYLYDTTTSEERRLTNDTDIFRTAMPDWSPDERYIVYSGYKYSAWIRNDSINAPDNWQLMLYDTLTSERTIIADGYMGKWSPDGTKIIFIANEGLKLYDLTTGETALGVRVRGNRASASMSIDVSLDGKRLAWASPSTHEIVLYNILSWEFPFRISKDTVRINVNAEQGGEAYYPLFSPDGKYLLSQETEVHVDRVYNAPTEIDDQLKIVSLPYQEPKIVLYELGEYRGTLIKDLSDSDFYGTALTDWR